MKYLNFPNVGFNAGERDRDSLSHQRLLDLLMHPGVQVLSVEPSENSCGECLYMIVRDRDNPDRELHFFGCVYDPRRDKYETDLWRFFDVSAYKRRHSEPMVKMSAINFIYAHREELLRYAAGHVQSRAGRDYAAIADEIGDEDAALAAYEDGEF